MSNKIYLAVVCVIISLSGSSVFAARGSNEPKTLTPTKIEHYFAMLVRYLELNDTGAYQAVLDEIDPIVREIDALEAKYQAAVEVAKKQLVEDQLSAEYDLRQRRADRRRLPSEHTDYMVEKAQARVNQCSECQPKVRLPEHTIYKENLESFLLATKVKILSERHEAFRLLPVPRFSRNRAQTRVANIVQTWIMMGRSLDRDFCAKEISRLSFEIAEIEMNRADSVLDAFILREELEEESRRGTQSREYAAKLAKYQELRMKNAQSEGLITELTGQLETFQMTSPTRAHERFEGRHLYLGGEAASAAADAGVMSPIDPSSRNAREFGAREIRRIHSVKF